MSKREPLLFQPHGLLPVSAQEILVRAAKRDSESFPGELDAAVATAVDVAIKKVRGVWPQFFKEK